MNREEDTLYSSRPTRVFYLKEYFISLLLLLIPVLLWAIGLPPASVPVYIALGLAFAFVLFAELSRIRLFYKITFSHVIMEKGLLSKKRTSYPIVNISDVAVHQSRLQRLLKFGTVMIGSSSGRDLFLPVNMKVRRPRRIAAKIEELARNSQLAE